MDVMKWEAFVRVVALVLLVLTAILVRSDTQTKTIFFTSKKATFTALDALVVLVCIDFVVAGYNLLQLVRCFLSLRFNCSRFCPCKNLAWISFLLDQAAVYLVFAANSAAFGGSILAVTGVQNLQWMKLCDQFTRFCVQIAGSLLCGYLASLAMIVVSSISAFSLFRLYSSETFFLLKGKYNN